MGSLRLKYLVDSVIVIDHFNAIGESTAFLAEHGNECALSVVTRAEVLAGFDEKAESLALELLDYFPTLPLTAETADAATRLRRAGRLKLPDVFQAALAIQHGLILVTRNTRDFRSSARLKVLVPYRL